MPDEVLIEAASDGGASLGGATLTANTDHLVAAANAERDRLIVSANVADVWLAYGPTAAVEFQGVVVRAGGTPWVETGWKGEVHCISAGAAVMALLETSYHVGAAQGEQQPGADTFVPSGPSDNYYQRAVPTAPPPGTPIT